MTFAVSKHDIEAVTKYCSAHRKQVVRRLQATESQEKGRNGKGSGSRDGGQIIATAIPVTQQKFILSLRRDTPSPYPILCFVVHH